MALVRHVSHTHHTSDGDTCSPAFWNFMKLMGEEIDLAGWKGYRGDMGAEGKTYTTVMKNEISSTLFSPFLYLIYL